MGEKLEKKLRLEIIALIRQFIYLNYPSLSNDIKSRLMPTPREKALYLELDKARAKIADMEYGSIVYEKQIKNLELRKDYWQKRARKK